MPSLIPAGPIAVAVDAMVTLVANMPFFQTWTGFPGDPTSALGRVFSGQVGFAIVEISISGGVATVSTRRQHTIQSGATVTLEGASIGPQSNLNVSGPQVVTGVTANAFTFATSMPDGDFEPDFAFVVPCPRPLAVVAESPQGCRGVSVGTGGASVLSGAVDVLIEADVTPTYANDPMEAPVEARNMAGQFLQGLIQVQGTADLMVLNNVELVDGPDFTSETEQDDSTATFERWRTLFRCSWGVEG